MSRSISLRSAAPWIAGSAAAVLVLGPVLRPGVLFNLDLIVPPRLDTPSGFWGLGPELPRRLPMWAVVAWVSALIPATMVAKALMFAAIAGAWAGMSRMVERLAPEATLLTTQSAAAIYALSPFVLTRAVVGHFIVTLPHALLPWLLPLLLRRPQRTTTVFLIAAALGTTGHFGGSLALFVVAVAALCRALDRPWRALTAAALAQAVWVVPGIVVAITTTRTQISGAEAFPTHARGFDGLARLSAGGGFWNQYFQVGSSGVLVAALGAALLGLALVGKRSLAQPTRRVVCALGIVGWAVAAASSLGGISSVFSTVNDYILLGIWRDGQRLLTLHLLWLAPCAALGAAHVARRAARSGNRRAHAALVATPLSIAVALGTPGLWGFGGQLAAEPLPASWALARSEIRSDPGTVLVLPWAQYFNLRLDDGPVRRVLNPIPLYVGGDVISSSDNGLSTGSKESADPREPSAAAIVERIAEGDHVGADLARLGVKWIVTLDRARGDADKGLRTDPSTEVIVDADNITLFRIEDDVLDETAASVEVDWVLPALATGAPAGEPLLLNRPASSGWRRGWASGSAGAGGLLSLPPASGPIWNAGAVVVLGAQALWAVAVITVVARVRRRWRSPLPVETPRGRVL